MNNLIYKISNDFNDQIYIGKTTRNLKIRINEHYNKTDGSNSHINNSMNSHGLEHFKIEILEDNIPLEKLNERERYWIAYYDSYYNGYNQTPGGEGRSLPDDIIQQIELLYQQGKTCHEISEILNLSHSTIYHRLDTYDWFNREENHQRSIAHFCKPIDQYDLNKNFIQTFPSINEAGRQLNIDSKQIQAGLKGHYRVKNFYFTYSGEQLIINKTTKTVGQFDPTTKELIQVYEGAREAARQIGVDSSCIIRACNSQDKRKSKGYIWRYI